MQNATREKLILDFMYILDLKTRNLDTSKCSVTNPWFLNMFETLSTKLNGPMVRNKSELKYYVKLFEENKIRYKTICGFLMYWSSYDKFRNAIPCEEVEIMRDYCNAYLLKPMVNEQYRQCRWKHWVERRLS